ncbi:hypothetical protein Hanom_Chr05g00422751 [Helianthus anomalus]
MNKHNKVYKSAEKEIRFETFKINLYEGRFGPMAASAKSAEERFDDYIKQYKKEYKTEDEAVSISQVINKSVKTLFFPI